MKLLPAFTAILFIITNIQSGFASTNEVVLTHKSGNTCINNSCSYDFFNMTHERSDDELRINFYTVENGNDFDSLYKVDEIGNIVDLGKLSCNELESLYYDESVRVQSPMLWLSYASAFSDLQNNSKSFVQAQEGHCYLMHKTGPLSSIILAFHVASVNDKEDVTIDEIEVFQKLRHMPVN